MKGGPPGTSSQRDRLRNNGVSVVFKLERLILFGPVANASAPEGDQWPTGRIKDIGEGGVKRL